MIKGYFNKAGHPAVEITAIGIRDRFYIEAIVDTGFDGDLCLPVQIAIQLGLELVSTQRFEMADGTIKNTLIFLGKILMGDEEKEIEIILTESDDALIGNGLLGDKTLIIDYLNMEITITPSMKKEHNEED